MYLGCDRGKALSAQGIREKGTARDFNGKGNTPRPWQCMKHMTAAFSSHVPVQSRYPLTYYGQHCPRASCSLAHALFGYTV